MDPVRPEGACARCRQAALVFSYRNGQFRFDLSRARALAQGARELVEVEEESVRASLEDVAIDPEHAAHVDATLPGIIAQVEMTDADGESVSGHVLVEGHHHAYRCLEEGRPFFAVVLDAEESRETLIPDELPPEHDGDLHEGITQEYCDRFPQSAQWTRRATRVIAGASSHDRRGFGPFPLFVDRAQGAHKWDVDGQRFIDFWMGHGALLCGHNFPPVVRAVTEQMTRGTHYGACHPLEVRWAELVRRVIPSADRVRFTASGTEATLLAGRIARAYTGRNLIIKFDGHFHGWHDEAMAHFYPADQAGFNPGAVSQVAVAHPAHLEGVIDLLSQKRVAAVILEPAGGSAGGLPWSREFLNTLRQATRDHDTLLVFDEVISGFRHGPGGVQAACGVTPDLTTLAKILCGGLPGGAVAGREDVMAVFGGGARRGDRMALVPHTGTFNANPLSAAAGIAMLEHIADGEAQKDARSAAEYLVQGVNHAAVDEGVDVFLYTNDSSIYHMLIGPRQLGLPLGPSEGVVKLSKVYPKRYALLRRALLLEGIDTHPVHGWVSAVHDRATLDEAIDGFARAFRRLSEVKGFQHPGRAAARATVS
jgi:glutamate-1-semialdehyde 2,1-aminomutase